MFKKISDKMEFPDWAGEGTRWRKLTIFDKLLDGTFYNHLKFAFYDEKTAGGDFIPLEGRRPSAQYKLPRYVSRQVSRKLFAGRHIPKVRAESNEIEKKISALLTGTHIWPVMFEAAYRGSVGSVAVTFRVEDKKIGLKVWRAVWCSPIFDDFGDLLQLRIHYIAITNDLAALGFKDLLPGRKYWFIRDYMMKQEVTYNPVLEDDWNPVHGFREPGASLVVATVIDHNLGFVPAIWICNPGGVAAPDGAALWEDAIPNSIEMDYLLSQASRGARYNCAPQLVTRGVILNENSEGLTRTPVVHLAFAAAQKGEDGEMLGEGDAKLLEMTGAGAETALKLVEALKKFALEQIGVVQKDLSEMPGPLSGRAMEYVDEDSHDTAMQWRNTYGEGGALPLICKIIQTLDKTIDVSKIWLQWPRIYQPTPGDLINIVNALKVAVTPIAVEGAKASEGESIPTVPPLLEGDIASAYLKANLDLGILDDTVGTASPGPEDDIPNAAGGEKDGVMGANGPFWRVYPPIKVKQSNR